jgi:hypothetical protein
VQHGGHALDAWHRRCSRGFREHLVSIRGSVLIGVILVAFVGAGHSAARSSTFPSILNADDGRTSSTRDASVDFNGNEVRPAVAHYKVDPAGALYEEHSPETEVPRLGSPKG